MSTGSDVSLTAMPLIRGSNQIGAQVARRLLVPNRPRPQLFPTGGRSRVGLKWSHSGQESTFAQSSGPLGSASAHLLSLLTRTSLQCLLQTGSIRERIYDKLILFTRMLHKQSNVYLSLQIRRVAQSCILYRRLYTPGEFRNVFVDNLLQRVKLFSFSFQRHSAFVKLQRFLNRHKYLLSFATGCFFSCDESRITDQELDELIQEFASFERFESSSLNAQNQPNGPTNGDDRPQTPDATRQQDGSFMVVSCMQADKDSLNEWEEVINQPSFHVWRKSVNNTSLYEYKGMNRIHRVDTTTNPANPCVLQSSAHSPTYPPTRSILYSAIWSTGKNGTSW